MPITINCHSLNKMYTLTWYIATLLVATVTCTEHTDFTVRELIDNYDEILPHVQVRFVYSTNPEVFHLNEIRRGKVLALINTFLNRHYKNNEMINITVTEVHGVVLINNELCYEFLEFLGRNGTNYITSDRQIQGNFSEICGQYSCLYLYYRCQNKSLKQFLKHFPHNGQKLDLNDAKAVRLYRKYFTTNNKNKRMKKTKKKNISNNQDGGGTFKNRLLCSTSCIQKCKPRLTHI